MYRYIIYSCLVVIIVEFFLVCVLIIEQNVIQFRVDLLEETNGYCKVALEKTDQLEKLRARLENAYRRILVKLLHDLHLDKNPEYELRKTWQVVKPCLTLVFRSL